MFPWDVSGIPVFITASPFCWACWPSLFSLIHSNEGLLIVWALNRLWNVLPPVSQPCLILAQVCDAAATCAHIPDLHKSRRKSFKKEDVLLHIISLQVPCWEGTAKWAQWNVSQGVCSCLWRVDFRQHASFSPRGTQNPAFIYSSHHLQICDL